MAYWLDINDFPGPPEDAHWREQAWGDEVLPVHMAASPRAPIRNYARRR